MIRLVTPLIFLSGAALAAECPPVPDQSDALQSLLRQAQDARDERSARLIGNQMWEIWATAPDARAQEMLDRGMNRRAAYDFEAAIAAFDELVAYCPHYAEGYNQRAFVNFIRENYEEALVDLDLAIERSPNHVAAISGKALTLLGLGDTERAQKYLKEALSLNPWIPERGLIIEPLGQDL